MPAIVASIACLILLGLAVLQAALIGGAPLGRFVWGGQHDVLPVPLRSRSRLAIVAYVVASLIILQGAQVIEILPELFGQIVTFVLAAGFFANFVFSAISPSSSERYLMGGTSLALAALTLIVAIAGPALG